MKRILSLILTLAIVCLLVTSCATLEKLGVTKWFDKDVETNTETPECEEPQGLWKTATYLKDTELGTGSKTIQVEVKVEDKSVTFTIHTDKTTLGDALLEHSLIAGENGAYGLYVKTVNGKSISGGEHYEIIYAK